MSENALVGRATYINGDVQEFTDAEEYIQCIREDLPYHATSGFRFETLTDEPAVRKAVSDIIYDFYGMENPHQREDYETEPDLKMTMGGNVSEDTKQRLYRAPAGKTPGGLTRAARDTERSVQQAQARRMRRAAAN